MSVCTMVGEIATHLPGCGHLGSRAALEEAFSAMRKDGNGLTMTQEHTILAACGLQP